MSLKDSFNFQLPPIYLMDASAFIYKGFYGNMKMTRADGFPTGAIYSVARVLLKLLKEEKPEYFSFIKDGKDKNFRHDIYPLYKANRSATPEELVQQFEPIEELVKAFGLHLEISKNCEADDCIASLAKKYREERNVVIVGIDKDLKQCLHKNVMMWDPSTTKTKESKIITLESFEESSGLKPEQWPDLQAIIGDSSDNIPGIKGVGPVTAEKLFKEFPTLEAIKENFENLPKTVKAKFENNLDAMFLYRQLTTLSTDCCKEIAKEDLALKGINIEACNEFFRTYEMPSLHKELMYLAQKGIVPICEPSSIELADHKEKSAEEKNKGTQEQEISSQTNNKKAKESNQMSLFDSLLSEDSKAPTIEKRTFLPSSDEIADVNEIALLQTSLIDRNGEGFYIAYKAKDKVEFIYEGDKNALKEFLSNFENFVCFNVKEIFKDDADLFSNVNSNNNTFKLYDLSLISYLLNPEQRDYSWPKISSFFRDKTRHIAFEKAGTLALALKDIFLKEMEKSKITNLYEKLELPLVPVLASMEKKGILLDIQSTQEFLEEVNKELQAQTNEIYKLAGKEFNIRSAQQTGEILFNHLQLKSLSKTKGGQISTSQENLEKLQDEHPIIDAILDFRKFEKLRSTYLEPLPKLSDDEGRIHTTFNQMATATGRLSSSNPNLQNIPIKGKLGQRVRSCFIAEENRVLISADYSQIELRVLAHYSREESLVQAFKEDEDIHKSTAALLNNVALEEVSLEQRQAAKTINFGLLYGMGARKLAQDIKVSTKEASAFIARYFERFSGIKAFYDSTLEEAKENGYVVTLAGRRRQLPDLFSQSRMAQTLAERQAINTLIQGSAADIIKIAMLNVYSDTELKSYDAQLLLQVHDELILSVPQEFAEQAGKRLEYLMSNVKFHDNLDFLVPLKVEYSAARNWLLAH